MCERINRFLPVFICVEDSFDDICIQFFLLNLKAEQSLLAQKLDKEYSPISGNGDFCKLSAGLALNESASEPVSSAVATVQSISGTGALRIGGAFLNSFAQSKDIYLPTPTWGNHIPIFKHSGLNVKSYRYYEPKTCGFDFQGALDDINVRIIIGFFNSEF